MVARKTKTSSYILRLREILENNKPGVNFEFGQQEGIKRVVTT